MTTINQELYEALKEAGASEDAAKRAAASVYDKDQLVSKMDLAVLDRHLAVLEARLGMIERVLWGIVIGVIALVVRAYVLPG
ncbi:MAG: hypothetical protein ACREVJ_00550 [Gammaproteobacteria bacterium]